MKDIKTILLILLSLILIATWGFYIYNKKQPVSSPPISVMSLDSTAFKKAVLLAVEDSLRKINVITKPDTVKSSVDSILQKPIAGSVQTQNTSTAVKVIKNVNSGTSGSSLKFLASGINFIAISKAAGSKPEITSQANEAEKFILSFVVRNKKISTSDYTVYVVIFKPDQKVLRSTASGKDYFHAGDEGWRFYSQKIHFTYHRNSKRTLTCVLKPESFSPGIYTVKIYYNGEVIGTATRQLQ